MYWRGGFKGEVLSALQISITGATHPQPTPTIAANHHHNALQLPPESTTTPQHNHSFTNGL
jgi:hypothetical protein